MYSQTQILVSVSLIFLMKKKPLHGTVFNAYPFHNDFFQLKLLPVFYMRKEKKNQKMNIQCDGL